MMMAVMMPVSDLDNHLCVSRSDKRREEHQSE